MKRKIYIYPPYNGSSANPGNTYSKLLWKSFEENDGWELTKVQLFKKPLFDLFFNLKADCFLFSWIEGMANTLFGKIKFLYVCSFIVLMKFLRKDIIWILHNKHPHLKETKSSKVAMRILAILATRVITHAKEGVNYYERNLKGMEGKCSFIAHPVYDSSIYGSMPLKWDYIIWGSVSPRKGILEFLEYASKKLVDKKILICGRCKDDNYSHRIEKLCGGNIKFINDFITDEKLRDYICASRYILFTYHESSVLSSGALIYSLNFCKPIIGPDVGNFRDLKGIVTTFTEYEDIPFLKPELNYEVLEHYLLQNQWKYFPNKIEKILNNEKQIEKSNK